MQLIHYILPALLLLRMYTSDVITVMFVSFVINLYYRTVESDDARRKYVLNVPFLYGLFIVLYDIIR